MTVKEIQEWEMRELRDIDDLKRAGRVTAMVAFALQMLLASEVARLRGLDYHGLKAGFIRDAIS
jgi:hypothetical protein